MRRRGDKPGGRNHHCRVTGLYGSGVARIPRQPPEAHSPDWPTAVCAERPAEVARLVAVNLRGALNGRSLRTVARLAGVDHTTIAAVLNGTTWADLATIARLEAGLDAQLWPVRDQTAARS